MSFIDSEKFNLLQSYAHRTLLHLQYYHPVWVVALDVQHSPYISNSGVQVVSNDRTQVAERPPTFRRRTTVEQLVKSQPAIAGSSRLRRSDLFI